MLEKVRIENYQSWRDLEFDLGQVTIFIGPTRSGKSAAMRALRGACHNMLGNYFVHHGEKNARVTIYFDGGKWVKWEKGVKNAYELFDGEKVLKFNKVSRYVPDEVREALKIWAVDFDDERSEELNFMEQFGEVFLLSRKSYPATLVTRIIGKVSRVQEVYVGLKLADTDLKRTGKERDRLAKNVVEFKENLKTFEALDEEKKEVSLFLKVRDGVRRAEDELAAIESLRKEMFVVGESIMRLSP